MIDYSIVVPTYNGGLKWEKCAEKIKNQINSPKEVLVIDSASSDKTVLTAKKHNFKSVSVPQQEFNHGKTRNFALSQLEDVAIVVFLTQDAILQEAESIAKLLQIFNESAVGAVYGKQIPRELATTLEKIEREFSYSINSKIYSYNDKKYYGMKTCFLSNAFTAYRLEALQDVGGFPSNVIVSEDMYVGARMLKAGWKLAYCAEAAVTHSHSYNLNQLFGRYFDIGVFNARESWIKKEFGAAEGEGIKYLKSELTFLAKNNVWLIPYSVVRNIVKYLGFKLGEFEKYLPLWIKTKVSRQKQFWR